MHKNCLPPIRRIAAVGSAVAIVAASSAFGIGAAAASAAEVAPATSTATSAPTASAAAGTATAAADTIATGPATAAGGTGVVGTGDAAGSTATAAPTAPTADPAGAAASTPTAPEPTAVAPTSAPAAAGPAVADASPASPSAPAADATPAGTVTISGTPRAWRTIAADTAGWPAGTTFTYRWAFHHPVVMDPDPGTGRTYLIDPEQADGTFTVTVTGTAPGKTPTSVTSAASAPVVTEDSDRQYTYGDRTVRVTRDEPFSVDLSPADNPDLSFFVNGSISGDPDPRVLPAGITLSDDGVLSGTLATGTVVPGPIWVHVSTPFHPEGGLSERLLLDVSPSADPMPLTFAGGGGTSLGEPVELDAQAGKPFSHTFRAGGGTDEPVRYEVRRPDGSPFPESDIGAAFPAGISLDPATGVLSGTETLATYSAFSVVATSGDQTAVQYVELRVVPGTAVALRVTVSRPGDPQQRTWVVEPDGAVATTWFPDGPQHDIARSSRERPTVAQGGTLRVAGTPIDAWGNITVPLDGERDDRTPLIVTSDVASDVAEPAGWNADVTFPHASTHTLTVTTEGVSTTFPVTVVPAAGTTGSLAFTGADTTAPIAWGLGLLASGAAVLALRGRRRRA